MKKIQFLKVGDYMKTITRTKYLDRIIELNVKDVEIICSFYEEAIFGLLIRWIIKEEKAKTVDEIKDTVERIEKLFEGQLDLIISNMKK